VYTVLIAIHKIDHTQTGQLTVALPQPQLQTGTTILMLSVYLKENLLKILVALIKRIKTLKLSIGYIWSTVLKLLFRLQHGAFHKHNLRAFSTDSRLRVDSIMGATQPTQNDILVNLPVITMTLAVRPLENALENPRTMSMPMQTSRHSATVTPHSNLKIRTMVATEILRYKRPITQYVLSIFRVLGHISN